MEVGKRLTYNHKKKISLAITKWHNNIPSNKWKRIKNKISRTLTKSKVKYICNNCKKDFYCSPSLAKWNPNKFCSRKCYFENRKGKNHPNWRGGRWIDNFGYIVVNINGRRIREHRYIIEQFLGRELKKNEVIHHINGNKLDNRIENLKIYKNQGKHLKDEWIKFKTKRISKKISLKCNYCKNKYVITLCRKNKSKFCSHKCYWKWLKGKKPFYLRKN